MVLLDTLISARDGNPNHLAISQHVNKTTMATTTTTTANTTPNAPNLLTLVTDSESIVSSIDTLTSYLDSELAPSTVMGPAPAGDPVSFESIVPRLDQYLDEWLWITGIPPNQITPRHRDELRDLADTMVRRELALALKDYRRHLGQVKIPEGLRTIKNMVQKLKTDDSGVSRLQDKLTEAHRDLNTFKIAVSSSGAAQDADRESTVKQFHESVDFLTQRMKRIIKLRAKDVKIQDKMNQVSPDDDMTLSEIQSKQLKELSALKDIGDKSIAAEHKAIVQHFGGEVKSESAAKGDNVALKFQESTLVSSGGQYIIPHFLAWLCSRTNTYYPLVPYLKRISYDVDRKAQTHWLPPTKHDGYASVPSEFRPAYAEKAENLYRALQENLPKLVWAKINAPFRHGVNAQEHHDTISEGDGPSAYFALLSIYRLKGAAYIQERLDAVMQSPQLFRADRPQNKIPKLREDVQELIKLKKPISWQLAGKPIRTILISRHTFYVEPLLEFADTKIVNPEDSARDLDRMLTVINDTSEYIERQQGLAPSNKSWNANVAQCEWNGGSIAGNVIAANNVVNRGRGKGGKGKGPGSGKGKGTGSGNGKGGRGKGSKGGRTLHRNVVVKGDYAHPRCQVKGCPESVSHERFKLCNTHHNEAIRDGGIKLYDGTWWTANGKRLNDHLNSVVRAVNGFSAAITKNNKKLKLQPSDNDKDEAASQDFLSQVINRTVERSRTEG